MRSNFVVEGGRQPGRGWRWWVRTALRSLFFGRQSSVHFEADDDFEIRIWQAGLDYPLIVRGHVTRGLLLTVTVENRGSPFLMRRSEVGKKILTPDEARRES